MIFQNCAFFIIGSCLLVLNTRVVQVEFFQRRNRIISTAEKFPDSLSDLSQSTAGQESLDLPRGQVGEDGEVGQEGEDDEDLVGGESEAVHTQRLPLLAQVAVEPDGQVVTETQPGNAGQQPVAVVGTAQLQVGGHLEVLDVGHHR